MYKRQKKPPKAVLDFARVVFEFVPEIKEAAKKSYEKNKAKKNKRLEQGEGKNEIKYREHKENQWHDFQLSQEFFDKHIEKRRGSLSITAMEIARYIRMKGSYPYGEVTFDIKIIREASPDCHYTVITDIDAAAVTKFVSTEIISLPEH